MVEKIKLSTDKEVDFNKEAPKEFFDTMISEILIPKYQATDDWNLSINVIIEEMNRLIRVYSLSPKLKLKLIEEIENHLDKDIQELTGVGKIEILFLNMDDYVEDVEKLILAGLDKQELRDKMESMIGPLTLFEIGELFIHLGKKAFLK